MMPPSIYTYIKEQEARYETEEIQLGENWNWNMKRHLQMIFHLKNGIFFTGENNWTRAFRNQMETVLELCDWIEDIELKDILFFIESKVGRVLSFLFKTYHDNVYSKKYNLDEMFDEGTESDNAYGGILLQKPIKGKPEVLDLINIAFADQSDLKGGPIGFKFNFSPDKLRTMSKQGWGDEKNGATISIEDLITLATFEREPAGLNGKKNQTTGKNIEVYIVRGNLPEHYLKDNNNMEKYYNQLHIDAFYVNKDSKKEGVTLYRKKEDEGTLKFWVTKKVSNRGLGRSMGERLLTPQIWTNFLETHKINMIEAGSKIIPYTDDENFANRNTKLNEMENNELLVIAENKKIGVVPTFDANRVQLFANSVNDLFQHLQFVGSAYDPILGKEPVSGTTFRGQERVVQQGRGSHQRKKGQRAKLWEEVYRDWIIPDMKKEILAGKEFLADLSVDEMGWVVEQLSENHANRMKNELVLDGQLPPNGMTFDEYKEKEKQKFIKDFAKKGNKHLIKILKDEFRDVEVKIGINIAGKQKDLAGLSDKLLSIFQSAFSNPVQFQQTLQIPGMAKTFNDILEYGGLSPVDFSTVVNSPLPINPEQVSQQSLQNPKLAPELATA